jgi:hypothetical protein
MYTLVLVSFICQTVPGNALVYHVTCVAHDKSHVTML